MVPFRRLLLGLMTSLAFGIAGLAVPVIPGAATPAYAQVSAEFQEALAPYGVWRRHPRWGEVWVPDELPRGWRPYEYGHWIYTDEWGWYWISAPEEEDWGWVVYHYGRWIHDRGTWFWVPDDEWAPAWVDWRYGGDYVGWAPLPPDELIVVYDDDPTYWIFVSPRYLAAPRLRGYYVSPQRRGAAFRQTRVVNRTLSYGRGRAAVNAGVSPAFVARASRAALPTYRVSPRVLTGTQGVSGAVRVTPQQLQAGRGGAQRGRRPSATRANAVTVQTSTAVAPAGPAAAPQPLGKGERGKLGTHPPRAAQGAPPPQPAAPAQPQPQQRQQQAPAQQPRPAAPAPAAPTPQQPPVQQHAPPPQAKPERPVAPQTPPPAAVQQPAPPPQAPVQRREPPPAPAQRREPPAPRVAPPAQPQVPPPPAVIRPAPPPHPAPPPAARPQPPAARPAPPPAPPPAAKPAPPHPAPPAKPAPEEKKKPEETPK